MFQANCYVCGVLLLINNGRDTVFTHTYVAHLELPLLSGRLPHPRPVQGIPSRPALEVCVIVCARVLGDDAGREGDVLHSQRVIRLWVMVVAGWTCRAWQHCVLEEGHLQGTGPHIGVQHVHDNVLPVELNASDSIHACTLHLCPEGAPSGITRWCVLLPCNSQKSTSKIQTRLNRFTHTR
jgi:hypothetical protein